MYILHMFSIKRRHFNIKHVLVFNDCMKLEIEKLKEIQLHKTNLVNKCIFLDTFDLEQRAG